MLLWDEEDAGSRRCEQADRNNPGQAGGRGRYFEVEIASEELRCVEVFFLVDGVVVFDEAEDSLRGHGGYERVLGGG